MNEHEMRLESTRRMSYGLDTLILLKEEKVVQAYEEARRLEEELACLRELVPSKQEFEIKRLAQRAQELRVNSRETDLAQELALGQMDPGEAAAVRERYAQAVARNNEIAAETARERALKNLAASDAEKSARRDEAFEESVRSHIAQQEAARRGKHVAQEPEEAPRRRGSYQGDPEAPIQSVDELNAVGRVREGREMKVTPTPIKPIPAPPELDGLLDGERTKRLPWWRR